MASDLEKDALLGEPWLPLLELRIRIPGGTMRRYVNGPEPCKHGKHPTQIDLPGTNEFGKRVVLDTAYFSDCAECRAEDALPEMLCECGEGQLVIHDESFRQCNSCGRGYTTDQLERLGGMSKRAQDAKDLRECWRDQLRKGDKSGGSGDKGPKKEDKLGRVTLKQANWSEKEIAKKILKQESLEPKAEYIRVRGLPEDATGEQVRKAVDWALRKRQSSELLEMVIKGCDDPTENGLDIEYPDTAQERT